MSTSGIVGILSGNGSGTEGGAMTCCADRRSVRGGRAGGTSELSISALGCFLGDAGCASLCVRLGDTGASLCGRLGEAGSAIGNKALRGDASSDEVPLLESSGGSCGNSLQ